MDGKRVYFTTTTYDNHTFQYPLISLGTYRLPKKSKEEIIIDKLLQIPSPQNRCEKNWLPFFRKGKVAVIYSFNPVVVYTIDPMNGKFEEVARQSSGLLTDSFRGSAGPLPYKGGYLTVVHEVLFRPGRHYLHRFVELDESFNIRRLSHSFFFRSWGVEYCSGLTMSVDEKSLLLTFGFNDGEAWIHQIEITAVEELLYNPRSPIIFNPPNSIQEIVDRERGTASFPPAPLTAPLSLEYDGMVVSKLPSEIVKLEFTVTPTAQYPGIWHPMNASIILFNGFKVLCRTTNYSLDEVTRVVTTHHPQGIIQTRNFLLELDDDLSICRTTEVVEKVNRYVHPSTYQGLEDPRIFLYQGELWFTATTWDTQVERVGRITLCRLNSEYEVNFFLPLVGPNSKRIEKNWIPYENDGLHLLYLYSPLLVYTPDLTTGICKLVTCKKTPSSWEKLRGSGGVIKYADGIVVMVHEVHHSPTWIYLHRFLWLEEDYSGAKLTQPFYFTHLGVEFAAGIAEEPKTGNLIITSGLRDAESVVIKVPRTAVENLLERSTYVALT